MTVIRYDQTRRFETPAGVMTTLASPTLGGASRPIWRVEMPAGSAGPVHTIDTEQIWTVLSGGASVRLGGDEVRVGAGDTLVLAPDVERQITADAEHGLTAIVTSAAGQHGHRRRQADSAALDRLTAASSRSRAVRGPPRPQPSAIPGSSSGSSSVGPGIL